MADQATRLILNGRLMTFDTDRPAAEALAIRDGVILAVGTEAEIRDLAAPGCIIHDAGGKTVLPGFIESHVHLFQGGAELDALNLLGVSGEASLRVAVEAYGAARPQDRLLYGTGADYHLLGSGIASTRQALDRVCPDRPFAMMASDHHTLWANTAALELAGLLQGGDAGEGAEIVMGADGLASGELRETGAFGSVVALTPSGGRENLGYVTGEDPAPMPSPADRASDRDIIARGLAHAARNGITTLHNMDGNLYQLELLSELQAEGRLLCRSQVPCHLKPTHGLDKLDEAGEMRCRFASDMLWSGRVKMFMDGVIESRTAFMLRGYPEEPENTGSALFGHEQFCEATIACDSRGLQISVHAIGDAAVRRTLDGYAAARAANGARDSRHRIEHIEVLHADDLPRFAELGVIASMQPLHSPRSGFFDPPAPGHILHEDQLALAFAWQTIRATGARMIFSTDWPVVPVEVMPSIKGACATMDCGRSWGDQRQSLRDALAGYTCDAAYAEFNENRKGRLKPGMMADIVVMSEDLEALAPQALDRAEPVLTICGGRVTFQA